MNPNSDPLAPENWNLSPEQLEALNAGNGARLEIWDGHPMVITTDKLPPRKTKEKYKWTAYNYDEQLKLARITRNPLLAVLAELHKLYFEAWDKRAPIEFNNSTLHSLGFNHHAKITALKTLETEGWITIQWRKRKSPMVTILQGFHHGF